jgi:TonB family protein
MILDKITDTRMKFWALLLCLPLLSALSSAQTGVKDVNAQISTLTKSVVVLREPMAGDKLRFASDGKLIGPQKPGTLLNAALIYVKTLKSDGKRLKLEGNRCLALYDGQRKQFSNAVTPRQVEISIELPGPSLQEAETALAAVFETRSVQVRFANYWLPDFDPSDLPTGANDTGKPVGKLEGKPVYKVRQGEVDPPKVIHAPEPEYPEGERRARKQGTALLYMILDETGAPVLLSIKRTSTVGFDVASLEAASKWKFSPAIMNGKPVAVLINVEVNFRTN